MLEVPERVKELYRMDSIPKKLRIAFYEEKRDALYPYEKLYPEENLYPAEWGKPWLLIENDRLVSEAFTLNESLCESDNIEFGSACSAMVEFTCADVSEDMTDKEFVISQNINDEYELMLGIYTVDSVELQDNKRFKKVKAFDRMLRFVTDVADWYNTLPFPLTLKNFRESLCEYIDVQSAEQILVNDEMIVTKTIDAASLNGRDVLKRIGEINGTFPHVQRTGELKFIDLSNTGLYPSEKLYPEENLYPSEPIGFLNTSQWRKVDFKEFTVPSIDLLQFRQEENDVGVTVGEGSNLYIVQGNFLIYGMSSAELIKAANNMYENIKDRFYRPHTTICNGLPFVEVGDGITVMLQKDAIESFVLKRVMTGIQALKDEYSAGGTKARKQSFGMKDQITQLQGKSAVLKRTAEELSNTISDVNTDLSSKISQTVDSITAEVKRATDAESSLTVRAEGIETNVSNFKENTNSKFEQTAEWISLKVSKGDVSSQLSIEDKQITISSNRLVIESTNFKLSADGTIFANNGYFLGKISGSSIEGSTIKGSVITSTGGGSTTVISDGSITSTADGKTTQIHGEYVHTNEITTSIINGGISTTGNWVFGKIPSVNEQGQVLTQNGIHYQPSTTINPVRTGGGSGPNVGLNGINIASVSWCSNTFQPLGLSDLRLKKEVQSMRNIKNIYLDFKVKSYRYKDNTEDNVLHFGLIAQQVLHTLTKNNFDTEDNALVEQFENRSYKDEGMYTGKDSTSYRIRYEELHAFHIQMIQEQQKEIISLQENAKQQKKEFDLLEDEITELKELVKKLIN